MPTLTCLDAASYPHILDGVLAYAQYPALLLLRRVSWSTKRKADACLATHVILHMPDFGPPVSTGERYLREYDPIYCCDRVRSLTVLSCAPGVHPQAPSVAPPLRNTGPSVLSPGAAGEAYTARFPRPLLPPASRLPGLMSWRDVATPEQEMRAQRGLRAGMVMDVCVLDSRRRARKTALERCLRAIEGVRIVDVPALEAAHLSRGAGFGAIDLLAVIKPNIVRFHSAWGPGPDRWDFFPTAQRRVLFAPLLRVDGGRWFVPTGDIPAVERVKMPAKDIVIHFTGAAAIPAGIQTPLHVDRRTMTLTKIVLIFSDVGGGEGESVGEDRAEGEEGERVNPWLNATAALVAFLIHGDITLVDSSPVLGTRGEIVAALEKAAMKRRQDNAAPNWRNDDGEEDDLARVRLLSKEEYREVVGDQMFAFDMVGLSGA
ncbi:uncharacterized protein CcaverHIS019_0309650 [Cutaneotrichosporon cavernicola]|uniref:Uncharacterized protein n=1 Tax=Cutaneotrichosporon cavernicola TaxID=279322 RepID=A0AA48IAK9_9TREE|nr:uncharacterized protein CcaverHIS019_0309650 [Cutaneotrichosporon cavernicola]BEI90895.1 hypothetical protein CcaverHIS019_0309650 [Cutaneotrichosporon cavernicola]